MKAAFYQVMAKIQNVLPGRQRAAFVIVCAARFGVVLPTSRRQETSARRDELGAASRAAAALIVRMPS